MGKVTDLNDIVGNVLDKLPLVFRRAKIIKSKPTDLNTSFSVYRSFKPISRF